MWRHLILSCLLAGLLNVVVVSSGCSTVKQTGRQRIMLVSSDQEQALGLEAYEEILANEQISTDEQMTAVVQRVGQRIAGAADQPDFNWEFKLLESPKVNAFCLPGGKVAVYAGLLPVAENEAGLAAVMGHEAAHAVARHGGERISQRLSVDLIEQLLAVGLRDASPFLQSGAMQAFGIGTKVGVLLPYSRTHEMEADRMGLRYMAQAGYDPREAVAFWQRMAAARGKSAPELLSTHPAGQRRIEQLEKLLPGAMRVYQAAPVRFGKGETW